MAEEVPIPLTGESFSPTDGRDVGMTIAMVTIGFVALIASAFGAQAIVNRAADIAGVDEDVDVPGV